VGSKQNVVEGKVGGGVAELGQAAFIPSVPGGLILKNTKRRRGQIKNRT